MYSKGYFKDKKITVMGLGLLGRSLGDSIFLAEDGADLIVTDLKSEDELKESVEKLKHFPNVKFVLGGHRLEDFRDRDFILKSAGVPLRNEYIDEAIKNNIAIEMSASLLCSLLPEEVKVIGITGTRGKSTVTHIISEALKIAGKVVHLGGNVRGVSTLSLLPFIKTGDYLVLELDSWQLQGFRDRGISPNVAVFTSLFKDHMNYYANDLDKYIDDKASIFVNQKEGDVFVLGKQPEELIRTRYKEDYDRAIVVDINNDVLNWKSNFIGEHNFYNLSLAREVLLQLGIEEDEIKTAVEKIKPVEGRLELLREKDGVRIYNDNNATTPEATLAGLRALGDLSNVVLIIGGADKGLDFDELVEELPMCKRVVFLGGTGTDNLFSKYNLDSLGVGYVRVDGLKEAAKEALKSSEKGDSVLFSPSFASFGLFKNEYDRNDQFVKIIDELC